MSVARGNVRVVFAAGAAVLVLAGASIVALAAAGGGFHRGWSAPSGECSAPALPGSVVDVTLTNTRGAMMRGYGPGGMMRVLVNKDTVPAGAVSLRVANTGSLVHELVVLPLGSGGTVGDRAVGTDGRVDETGSVGEASRTCGAGAGDGIAPGGLGWTTLQLPSGSYELICNLAGHYAGGMYTELTVT